MQGALPYSKHSTNRCYPALDKRSKMANNYSPHHFLAHSNAIKLVSTVGAAGDS